MVPFAQPGQLLWLHRHGLSFTLKITVKEGSSLTLECTLVEVASPRYFTYYKKAGSSMNDNLMESVLEVALQKPEVSCHACCKRLESSLLTAISFTPTLQCMYMNRTSQRACQHEHAIHEPHFSLKRQAQIGIQSHPLRRTRFGHIRPQLRCIVWLHSKFKVQSLSNTVYGHRSTAHA